MTEIYFVRHCESNHSDLIDRTRRLTEKGLKDSLLVSDYLKDKKIDCIYSSPYIRTVDTIRDFSVKSGLKIVTRENLREIELGVWVDDFLAFMKEKWEHMDSFEVGESILHTQERNIEELHRILKECEGKNVVISTHGMALSSILHYYDPNYGYEDFVAMLRKTPWIVHMSFEGDRCIRKKMVDLL